MGFDMESKAKMKIALMHHILSPFYAFSENHFISIMAEHGVTSLSDAREKLQSGVLSYENYTLLTNLHKQLVAEDDDKERTVSHYLNQVLNYNGLKGPSFESILKTLLLPDLHKVIENWLKTPSGYVLEVNQERKTNVDNYYNFFIRDLEPAIKTLCMKSKVLTH